jgi:hypothetical protein
MVVSFSNEIHPSCSEQDTVPCCGSYLIVLVRGLFLVLNYVISPEARHRSSPMSEMKFFKSSLFSLFTGKAVTRLNIKGKPSVRFTFLREVKHCSVACSVSLFAVAGKCDINIALLYSVDFLCQK